jgi:hypothetical protein
MSIQISGADQARIDTAYAAFRDCNELERALVIDRINRDTPKRKGRPRGSKNKICASCRNGDHDCSSQSDCQCPCHSNLRKRTEDLLTQAVEAQRPGDLGALMGEVDARIELELIEAERPE